MTEFNAAVALAAGVVLVLGLFAGYVKNRLWVAETTICVVVGIVVGPAVLGLVDPADLPFPEDDLLLEVARLTLGIAVMGAALRLPTGYLRGHVRALLLSLGPGLVLMWLTSAGLAAAILGLPILPALLLGALLAPTDPVVAGSITEGKVAEENLPDSLRSLLTAESGANDGLGLAFVLLPLLLIEHAPGVALVDWLTRVLLWEVVGAVVLGAAAGWLAGWLLLWAYRQPFSDDHSLVTIGLALSLTVLSLVRLIGSDGILAVFAAGIVFARFISRRETRHEHAQAAIGRFFDLPAFILIGMMLPWGAWQTLGWTGVAFAAAVLLFRRLPWWLLLRPLGADGAGRGRAAFLGWFGPVGVATTYYAMLAGDRADLPILWDAASLVVFASVLAHGISATPLTGLLGRIDRKSTEQQRRPPTCQT